VNQTGTITFQPELSSSATSDFRGVEMIFHSNHNSIAKKQIQGGTPSSHGHLLTTKPHGIAMWFAPWQ